MRAVPITCRLAGATPSGLDVAWRSMSSWGGDVAENASSAPASSMTASCSGAAYADAASSWRCGA